MVLMGQNEVNSAAVILKLSWPLSKTLTETAGLFSTTIKEKERKSIIKAPALILNGGEVQNENINWAGRLAPNFGKTLTDLQVFIEVVGIAIVHVEARHWFHRHEQL
jgi:hypothetical protein